MDGSIGASIGAVSVSVSVSGIGTGVVAGGEINQYRSVSNLSDLHQMSRASTQEYIYVYKQALYSGKKIVGIVKEEIRKRSSPHSPFAALPLFLDVPVHSEAGRY